MQIVVKRNGVAIGTMDESDVRDIVRSNGGRIIRLTPGQKWFPSFLALNASTTARTRALCIRDSGGAATVATQMEELYSGFRVDHTDGPVTATTITLKRAVGRGRHDYSLQPWTEKDRFPRKRFNPDLIPMSSNSHRAIARTSDEGDLRDVGRHDGKPR
jgi:hypothetical protein